MQKKNDLIPFFLSSTEIHETNPIVFLEIIHNVVYS